MSRVVNTKSNLSKLKTLVNELTKRDEDIFSRKEVLQAIVEASSDGLWDWNIQTNTAFLSVNYKKQLGYEDHELANSPETWNRLMVPEDLKRMGELIEKHVESNGEIPFKIVAHYKHKNGHLAKILCRGKVIEWDDEGNPIRMVGMHVDLTGL